MSKKEDHHVHKRESLFIIVFENNSLNIVIAKQFFRQLAKIGTLFSNYRGIYPTSQVNYWAMTGGSTFSDFVAPTNDPVDLPFTSVFNLLDHKKISWKVYQEAYPNCSSVTGNGACAPCGQRIQTNTTASKSVEGKSLPLSTCNSAKCVVTNAPCVKETVFTEECKDAPFYVRKHNPAISYDSIRNNPCDCAKIVNASQLQKDIIEENLPQVAFYTPTMFNNGHDTSASWSNEYLLNTWSTILRDPRFFKNRIVIITYDENGLKQLPSGNTFCTTMQQDPVYMVFLGPSVKSGNVIQTRYCHYNLLRTIEDHFCLGTLCRCDKASDPMTGYQAKEKLCDKAYIKMIECATIKAASKPSVIIPVNPNLPQQND